MMMMMCCIVHPLQDPYNLHIDNYNFDDCEIDFR